MKKAAIIIIAVLILLVGGVSAYVAMIDWNEHKDKIAAQFSEVTGKKVVFEGPVSFTIFPSPYLTASSIKIYNQEGENQDVPLAVIKSLVANLSLGPLLRGNFEVKMMSLIEPRISIEIDEKGKLNWQSSMSEEQKLNLEDVEITLDSVLLEKATLDFSNIRRDVHVKLENLNAEVIAPSLFGPYRIEGSYIKDNNPEGFAMSLGQLSDSFATSVNFVLNHPTSQTFVRFDGSMLLKNDALNGNLVIDSKKPVDFINKNFKDFNLGAEYDYPLAVSAQVDTNKTKIGFSNIVVKYGTTAGAGNILIPLADEFADEEEAPERRNVEVVFEMTDLDLNPVAAAIKSTVLKYGADGAVYHPDLNFDFIADLKSINTTYNGQNIKDFNFSADYVNNDFIIRNLSATLPGETDFKTTGDIFSADDVLTYTFNPEYTTNDLQRLLAWLGYRVDQITPATYKRSSGNASLEGTLKTVKLAPFEFSIDKSSFNGSLGVITGERNNIFLEIDGDNINFDNYIKPLPKEEMQKSFAERMNYRFGSLGFLNDMDIRVVGKLGLGIYESIPFENTQFDIDTALGIMTISKLNIGTVANAAIEATGTIKGMGGKPSFENLKYSLNTKDFPSFLNKFEVSLPDLNLKNLKNFSSKGIVTGSLEKLAMKAVSKLEYIDTVYAGQAARQNGKWQFNGTLELKAPDFVQLVNDFYFDYKPKAFSLGIFNLSSKIVGDRDKLRFSGLNAFVGSNNFKGDLLLDRSLGRPNIITAMEINKFEFERFFYNENQAPDNKTMFRGNEADNADFIARPFTDKTKINYDFFKKFDLNGKFKIGSLSYRGNEAQSVVLNGTLKDAVLNVTQFSGDYNGGTTAASFEMGMSEMPYARGELELKNQKMNEREWSGKKYGIKSGTMSSKMTFFTLIGTVDDMLSNLGSEIEFTIEKPLIKGWNLAAIAEDVKKRDRSEGLTALVQDNLQSGETLFDKATGKVKIVKAQYEFENTQLIAPDWTIKMTDTGSLDAWDMNAEFTAVMAGDKVKPFTFSLKGPMFSPELSVDVKKITDTYDAHWAKIAADEKAAEEARKAHLKALMDEQQQTAKTIQQRLYKEIMPELENYRKLTDNAEILEKYKIVDDKIKNISKGLDEVIVQGMIPEFDESLPKALAEKNAVLDERSSGLINDILAVYEQDVKQRINGFYNNIVDTYNQSKADVNAYRDSYGEFGKRLAMIKTLLDIEQDAKVTALKKDIEDRLLALDAINTQVVKDYIYMQNSHNLKQLEEYAAKIATLDTQSAADLEVLNRRIEELFEYSEALTEAEEKAYDERMKQEEIKKKLEENTGKISAAGGKDITVIRDIEEIEKMEAAKEKEDIPVLDFSGKVPSGIIKKPTIILDAELADEEDTAEEFGVKNWHKLEPVKREVPQKENSAELKKDIKAKAVEEVSNNVSENKETKPLLVRETGILRQPSGQITKASGKIIRIDD